MRPCRPVQHRDHVRRSTLVYSILHLPARIGRPQPVAPHQGHLASRREALIKTPVLARNGYLSRQVVRPNLPRYFITWSGHLQACVQDWPSRNRGVFPAVDHDRSRT